MRSPFPMELLMYERKSRCNRCGHVSVLTTGLCYVCQYGKFEDVYIAVCDHCKNKFELDKLEVDKKRSICFDCDLHSG